MRVIANFMQRDDISVHCIAEDAKTVVSGWIQVPNQEILINLLRYVGANDAGIVEAETDMRRWGRGGIHITLIEGRKNLLQLFPQYAKVLRLS